MWGVRPRFSWQTSTPGYVPSPAGRARYALIAASWLGKVMLLVLTAGSPSGTEGGLLAPGTGSSCAAGAAVASSVAATVGSASVGSAVGSAIAVSVGSAVGPV